MPARSLGGFSEARCSELLDSRKQIVDRLTVSRAELADTIEEALTQFDVETRRLMLKVRRDCFNGRNLGKHEGKPGWIHVLSLAGLAEEILGLEARLDSLESEFTDLYLEVFTRERHHLRSLVGGGDLLRAIALNSSGLVRNVRRNILSLQGPSRFEPAQSLAKWELSCLRFITRAAAKLSANSTLTKVASGSLRRDPRSTPLLFPEALTLERSRLRLNRPQSEQLLALVMRHPAVRPATLVAWNDSLQAVDSTTWRYLREAHWTLSPKEAALRHVPAARIRIGVSRSELESLKAHLGDDAVPYQEVALQFERDGFARSSLDRFLDIGLLLNMPPWPTYEPWLEWRVHKFLKRHVESGADLGSGTGLQPVVASLGRLLELEAEYSRSDRPEEVIATGMCQ